MAKEPVTIGNQKFIYDEKRGGWIDSKSKQPADKGLLAILNSVSKETNVKPKRLNIDPAVAPVSMGTTKFVYDKNLGWIDEKSKVPADPKFASMLDAAVGVKKKAVTEIKKDVAEKAISGVGSIVKPKDSAAYKKISDRLGDGLASIQRINGHTENLISANRFKYKEESRISREKAREGGSSGATQTDGTAAQSMSVMAVLVSSVTDSMNEFVAVLKDTKQRGGFGGGGLGGVVNDVVEGGSSMFTNIVGGAIAAVGVVGTGLAIGKKATEDDERPGVAPIESPAATRVDNQQAQTPEEGQGEEEEPASTTSSGGAAVPVAAASKAAAGIPTREESESGGDRGGGSKNIKVQVQTPEERGKLEEPQRKSKTSFKVAPKKEEKKEATSKPPSGQSARRVSTGTPPGGAKGPAQATSSRKEPAAPKVSWAKAFADIGKALTDIKKSIASAIRSGAGAIQRAGSAVSEAVSGAVTAVTETAAGMGETVNAPTSGNAALIFQTAKRKGYDDRMAVAFVSVAQKESGLNPARGEVMNYTSQQRLVQVFGNRVQPNPSAYLRNPQALANKVYGPGDRVGRSLGNTGPNDGWTYRGRGFNQLTGKANYADITSKLARTGSNINLVRNPDALADPRTAVEAFFAFYETNRVLRGRKTARSQSEANRLVTDATGGREGFSNTRFGQENLAKVEGFSRNYTSAGTLSQLATGATEGAAAVGSAVVSTGQRIGGAITAAGRGVRGMAYEASRAAISAMGIRGTNGNLETSQLAPIGVGSLKAAPPAAQAIRALRTAAERDGVRIGVTDAYRNYATQVDLKRRKGRMAATPGRSNHGWGLAFDLSDNGSGLREGSRAANWLRQNAPRFGIFGPLASPYELWHWEYRGGGTGNSNTPTTPPPQERSAPAGQPPRGNVPAPRSDRPAADQAIQQVAIQQAADRRRRNAAVNGGNTQTRGGNTRAGGNTTNRGGTGGGNRRPVESSGGLWKSLFG